MIILILSFNKKNFKKSHYVIGVGVEIKIPDSDSGLLSFYDSDSNSDSDASKNLKIRLHDSDSDSAPLVSSCSERNGIFFGPVSKRRLEVDNL